MQFKPKSAEQLADENLLPEGDYDFTVREAEESTSKAGNEMIVLKLDVHDGVGGKRSVIDYLVSTDSGLRKIRSFAVTCGILQDYEQGRFDASRLSRLSGRAKLKKDSNLGYEPKNAVAWYLDPAKESASTLAGPVNRRPTAPARQMQSAGYVDEDEIPF